MTYRGMRHGPKEVLERIGRGEAASPSEYYVRTVPFFETASEKYGWLNKLVSVAIWPSLSGSMTVLSAASGTAARLPLLA
jgi:hypothetical protein